MANSTTNNNAWEDFFSSMPSPSATLPASLSPDSQSLDRVSLGEPRDLAEVQGWFSNAEINMNNLSTIVEDSVPRRPSVQRSPKMLGDAVSPRRNSQMYVLRTEFVKEIRGLMEKLNKLQERWGTSAFVSGQLLTYDQCSRCSDVR